MTLALQNDSSGVDESQLLVDDFSDNGADHDAFAPLSTKKLRPTSDNDEPVFDRFVSLSKRLFDVPIALVTIVDIDRSWFKANVGLEGAIETIQDASLCAYAILPDSPDVFVVPDTRQDVRFLGNPLVTGAPYIRFYAGAALLVNDMKIGSLCIVDTEPRPHFSRDDALNLMELGVALSNLVQDRKDKALQSTKANAKMMSEMMQSLVYSVVRTNKATYQLIKDQEVRKKSFYDTTACSFPMEPSSPSPSTLKAAQLLLSAKSSAPSVHPSPSPWTHSPTHTHQTSLKGKDKDKDEDNNNLLECTEPLNPAKGSTSSPSSLSTFYSNAFVVEEHVDDEDCNMKSVRVINKPAGLAPSEGLVSDLQDAVGHLKVVFESNICLSDMEVAKSSALPVSTAAPMVPCDVLKTINHARATLSSIARTSNVVWNVDTTHLSVGSRHCVSLKSLYFVLLSMIERFIEMWSEVRVHISFQRMDSDNESAQDHYRAAFRPHIANTEEYTLLTGRLLIQFGYSKKKIVSEEFSASRGLVSLHALNQVLSDAGGGSSVRNWAQSGSLGSASGASDSHTAHRLRKDNEEILQMSDCRGNMEGLVCWIPCGVIQKNLRGERSSASQQSSVSRRIDRLMNLFLDSSERKRSDEICKSVPKNIEKRVIKLKDATPPKSEGFNNNNRNNRNNRNGRIPWVTSTLKSKARFGFSSERVKEPGSGSHLLCPSTLNSLKAKPVVSQRIFDTKKASSSGAAEVSTNRSSFIKEYVCANEPFAIVDGSRPFWESHASSLSPSLSPSPSSYVTSTLFPQEVYSPPNWPSRKQEEEKVKASKEQTKLRASLCALSSAALLSALVEDDLKLYNNALALEEKNKNKSMKRPTFSSVITRLSGSLNFSTQSSQSSPSASVRSL